MLTTELSAAVNSEATQAVVHNLEMPQEPESPSVDQSSAKFMIVDDEPTNIKVVRRLLEIEGYRNFVVTTDSSAARYLIDDQRPDLVLLDLMMPMVSGLDILSSVRQDLARSFLPIIILTAATDRETRLQAL